MEFFFQSISMITKIYRQKALWRSVMWQKRNLRQCRIFSNWDQSDRLRCSLPSKYIFDPQIQYLSSLSDYFVAQFNTMQQPTNFERLRVWWWTLMLDFFTFIENWYHKLPIGKIVQKIVFIFIATSMLFVSRSFIISLVTTVMGEFMEPVYRHWQNIKTILNIS